MAIDKKPAVGRILVRESIFLGGFFREGGVITGIKGNRISYAGSDEGGIRGGYVYKFAAVCDTPEEEARLLAFEKRVIRELLSLKRRHSEEAAALITGE